MERLRVTVSDPWDFTTATGSNVFTAEVRNGGEGQVPLLLRFTEPVRWHGNDWHWFVGTRRSDATFYLHGVAEAQTTGDEWLEVPSAWRGQSPAARAAVEG